MLYYLSLFEALSGPLRLFKYVSFRSVMALLTSLFIVIIFGPKIFKYFNQIELNDIGRNVDEIGELSKSKNDKKFVPTLGGLAILLSVFLSSILWVRFNIYSYSALWVGLIFGFVGLIDDGLKLYKKTSNGISSHWKWLIQGIGTLIFLYILFSRPFCRTKIAQIYMPFIKNSIQEIPLVILFIYSFMVICGSSNAVNLTDGLDGLAVGCSIPVFLTYAIFAYITGNIYASNYLYLTYVNGVEELTILCFAIIGAFIGFLWYNSYPAEIFMGDTGSLAIGGWIGSVALITNQSILLLIVGGVFVFEALSVILQVVSFKVFNKRIFKMAPFHHHLELCNIPEVKIVARFWIISLLSALLGLFTLKLR